MYDDCNDGIVVGILVGLVDGLSAALVGEEDGFDGSYITASIF